MPRCATCGEENPERARFCLSCGAAFAATPAAGEERKVVSVLFVDLVGFTARSERSDPEDVRALLRPYHAGVKTEIERFGGTVEKFIGDAVMAVFGAPVAHEDDPERAVRAALRVLETIDDLNAAEGLELAVRAAVATGEAVVSLGARPGEGEGIATGDVVNTASRLQGEAPVGGVVVNEQAFRATRAAVEYEELAPVTVKGKADPVPLWRAVRARSRFGVDAEAAPATPFVGREHESRLLEETFERMLRESTIQLVTVVGEPGVGKTRLLAEFRAFVDNRPELVYWRQGRCLPYGEGITFWALGEIVKAHAGILESDGEEEASAKLRSAVEAVTGEDGDRDWLGGRLAPLVGLAGGGDTQREELFTAWQAFLEAVAAQRPLILLVEDLHWGDSALFEFVERLVDWSTGVPILVVCTGRPELYDRRPGWGGGKRNSNTVALSPLSHEETARLVAALLESAVLPAETQQALLERAGGNPLYAEEYVRMFRERGSAEELPLPETVQGLIAARLDSLPPERKALLQDASVLGKVFWAGGLEAMTGRSPEEVRDGLHQLALRELVRRARSSSVEGQAEFTFWHALIRDVAYGQIPRAARAEKHRAAADWIEAMAGERLADHAELLAHHTTEALSLSRAAGADPDEELRLRAGRFLVLAGDRASMLDAPRAELRYRQALDHFDPRSADYAHTLVKAAEAARVTGRADIAAENLELAAARLEDAGDTRGAATALSDLGRVYFALGGGERQEQVTLRAIELLEGLPPGPELVVAYGRMAAVRAFRGRPPAESIEWAKKALALGAELGLRSELLGARQWHGILRCELGDLDGRADLEQTLRDAIELGASPVTVLTTYINLSGQVWRQHGPAAALALHREAGELSRRRGLSTGWLDAESCWMQYDLGQWDDLCRTAEAARGEAAVRGQPYGIVSTYLALVLLNRGAADAAAAILDEALPHAREVEDPQVLGPALVTAALLDELRGEHASARDRIAEWNEATRDRSYFRTQNLADAARVACAAGDVALAGDLCEGIVTAAARDRLSAVTARAVIAEADGDHAGAARLYDEAASGWSGLDCVLEHGLALLGRARCTGDPAGLDEARRIFAGLGAAPLVAEVDDLGGSAGRASAR